MADEELSREEISAFDVELLTAADLFAQHWADFAPPTGASTAAFVLLAARVYVSADEPLTLEEFVGLARSLYERAQQESAAGALVNIDDVCEVSEAPN